MHSTPTQGELRLVHTVPASTTAGGPAEPDLFVPDPLSPVPLARLRTGDRAPITAENCIVRDCPICAWRKAGLIPPATARRL